VAIAIIINLFGVYKVELHCAVDYYPYAGGDYNARRRAAAQQDPSHPPAFNGFDQEAYKKGLLLGSQYKVRQVLKDILEMPGKMKETGQIKAVRDMKPQQIITLRSVDVEALIVQLKALYGEADKRIEGVWVRGERQGMWATSRPDVERVKFPQMCESIHVGY